MDNNFSGDRYGVKGKKLLILSGNTPHIKIVKAARELGVYTIVTDYLEPDASPAKQFSDEYWMMSYGDVEGLSERCRQEHVDGVLTCYHESALIPYDGICKEMGWSCYGNLVQFEQLMNKRLFKQLCQENGIAVIPEYSVDDALKGDIEFPVMVKPADRCGSKGQSICNNQDELNQSIKAAIEESISGEVIIEKYVANKNSFQVTYFFVNGKPYIIRTVDGYKGSVEDNLDRVALCSISPSIYTNEYLQTTSRRFTDMLQRIGVENGPVMAQGFYDDGVFRFYDPGRRFPGTDFEVIYREEFGIDLMKMMVIYALTGEMPEVDLKDENVYLSGKKVVVLFPTLRAGTIGKISGYEELESSPRIRNIGQKHGVGAKISKMNTALQRIFEIDFISNSSNEIRDTIRYVQDVISVEDMEGKDMLHKPFDPKRIPVD